MSPYDESWVIASKPLPGGGRYVVLKPAPIPDDGLPTVNVGRARRLIRLESDGTTIALNNFEVQNGGWDPRPRSKRRGPKRG